MRARTDVDRVHPPEYAAPSSNSSPTPEPLAPSRRRTVTVPLAAIFLPGPHTGPLTPGSSESDADTLPALPALAVPAPMSATPPTPPTDPESMDLPDPDPTDATRPVPTPTAHHTHTLSHPGRMPQVWLTFRLAHADGRDLTVPMIVHHRVHDYIPLIRHQLGLGLGLRFVYAGVLVRPEDTPLSLGIRGPDVVEVVGGEV